MKKLLLLFIAFTSVSTFASAQSLSTGIKGGVNLGTANLGDIKEGWESDGLAAGIHAGFFLNAKVGPIFLQPEAYYTFTQANLSRENISSPQKIETYEIDYHRVDVPVLVGFRPLPVLRIFAGPFATVLLNMEQESSNSVFNQSLQEHKDDLYNRAGWGWQAGLGVDILKLTLDARYEATVGNLRDQDLQNIEPSLSWLPGKNSQRQFVISLGYKF